MQNVTYRKAVPAEREKYLDFANLVFSNAHDPHDFRALIPKVYGDGVDSAAMHHIAIREDGSIRGLVGVMPNTLRVGDRVLKTGYVGSVAVHPYARGEGHMKRLMTMAIGEMEREGTDLAMLGGQRQRYEYFGFTRGGLCRSYRITATNLRHVQGRRSLPQVTLEPAQPGDIPACAALHAARGIAARRSPEDFDAIARTWYSTLRTVRREGEFAGYVIGSGASLRELMLTDWDLTLPAIAAYLRAAGVEGVSLDTGMYETELNRRLAAMAESVALCESGMLRIFHFPRVIGALLSLQARILPLADGVRSFRIDGQPMTVTVEGGIPRVTDEALPDALALTAMEAQSLFLGIDGELAAGCILPAGWSRLPLYMSHQDAF